MSTEYAGHAWFIKSIALVAQHLAIDRSLWQVSGESFTRYTRKKEGLLQFWTRGLV